MIFTVSADRPFSSYSSTDIPHKDFKLSIFFETPEMMEETLVLLRFNCPESTCEHVAQGWNDLKLHVRAVHGKLMWCAPFCPATELRMLTAAQRLVSAQQESVRARARSVHAQSIGDSSAVHPSPTSQRRSAGTSRRGRTPALRVLSRVLLWRRRIVQTHEGAPRRMFHLQAE